MLRKSMSSINGDGRRLGELIERRAQGGFNRIWRRACYTVAMARPRGKAANTEATL